LLDLFPTLLCSLLSADPELAFRVLPFVKLLFLLLPNVLMLIFKVLSYFLTLSFGLLPNALKPVFLSLHLSSWLHLHERL
jgi:hypothetical protein